MTSPNGQEECAGIYVLVAAERPNGQPVWEQSCGGGHWLYSGKTGNWCIGGQDVRESRFDTEAGWLYSRRRHRGRMPQAVGGQWWRWDGSQYQEDDAIGIAVVQPPRLPPTSCSPVASGGESSISNHSHGSASLQSPPQSWLSLSSACNSVASPSAGLRESSAPPPPPPPRPPSQPSAAESGLRNSCSGHLEAGGLRGSSLEERVSHLEDMLAARHAVAAHVGSRRHAIL